MSDEEGKDLNTTDAGQSSAAYVVLITRGFPLDT